MTKETGEGSSSQRSKQTCIYPWNFPVEKEGPWETCCEEERGITRDYIQKTNFSVGVNIYTPKVTSIWYCLRASQRPKRWRTDWFSGSLVRYSILGIFPLVLRLFSSFLRPLSLLRTVLPGRRGRGKKKRELVDVVSYSEVGRLVSNRSGWVVSLLPSERIDVEERRKSRDIVRLLKKTPLVRYYWGR